MIIIKYFEWLKIQPDYREAVYELCNDDFEKVRVLSKEKAVEMIRANKLTMVHRNIAGTIWR